mgnify:FL=1
MFKIRLIYLLGFFLFPFLILSQINERVLETEINNLVIGVNHAYSKDISSGTRTFLLSLKKDDGVSAYCRNRLEAELLGALNGTKFEVVFQPFLQEKTLKYIESTDTTFKVENQSSYAIEFGNMRNLVDSLKDYNIDLVIYSKLFLTPTNHLLLKTALIDLKSLEILSAYTFYGSNEINKFSNRIALSLNFYHGQTQNSTISRSYGPSQSLTINPFNSPVYIDGMSVGVSQYLSNNHQYISAGLLINFESNYLNYFDDYIYNNDEFQIRSISIAPSLGFHLKNFQGQQDLGSIFLTGGFGKSELNRSFYYLESELRLHLTKRLAGNFRSRYYLSPIEMYEPFFQNINHNNIQLCGGFSIQF